MYSLWQHSQRGESYCLLESGSRGAVHQAFLAWYNEPECDGAVGYDDANGHPSNPSDNSNTDTSDNRSDVSNGSDGSEENYTGASTSPATTALTIALSNRCEPSSPYHRHLEETSRFSLACGERSYDFWLTVVDISAVSTPPTCLASFFGVARDEFTFTLSQTAYYQDEIIKPQHKRAIAWQAMHGQSTAIFFRFAELVCELSTEFDITPDLVVGPVNHIFIDNHISNGYGTVVEGVPPCTFETILLSTIQQPGMVNQWWAAGVNCTLHLGQGYRGRDFIAGVLDMPSLTPATYAHLFPISPFRTNPGSWVELINYAPLRGRDLTVPQRLIYLTPLYGTARVFADGEALLDCLWQQSGDYGYAAYQKRRAARLTNQACLTVIASQAADPASYWSRLPHDLLRYYIEPYVTHIYAPHDELGNAQRQHYVRQGSKVHNQYPFAIYK